MTHPPTTPEERYAALVTALVGNPDVTSGLDEPTPRNRFGASGLKIGGKIFAMLVRGKLVVKLPKPRVDALVASGDGERYDPRHDGRLMKEWVTLAPTSQVEWLPLATEAMSYVATQR